MNTFLAQVVETTLHIFRPDLLSGLSPLTIPSWYRVRASFLGATSGEDWVRLFGLHNSGTCEHWQPAALRPMRCTLHDRMHWDAGLYGRVPAEQTRRLVACCGPSPNCPVSQLGPWPLARSQAASTLPLPDNACRCLTKHPLPAPYWSRQQSVHGG